LVQDSAKGMRGCMDPHEHSSTCPAAPHKVKSGAPECFDFS
jgi:hypothetical protein